MGQEDSDQDPNTAFADTPAEEDWIEVFHSRRNWATTQVSFSADGAPWVPFGKFEVSFRPHRHALESLGRESVKNNESTMHKTRC